MKAEELKEKLHHDNVVIIDVRMKDDGYDTGEAAYKAGHIPGAIFLDVEKDVTGEGTFLPEPQSFIEKLGALGVSEEDHVILYDQGNHRAASKVWIALYQIGHQHVYIVNGGFMSWKAKQYEQSTDMETKVATSYEANIRQESVMSLAEVKKLLEQHAITLIDSRNCERYSGQSEPKYKKAGHIPGAVNYETKNVIDKHGKIKDKKALEEHFKGIDTNEYVVVSCGSGNSAAVSMVALLEAGYENVALFPGGFSEWIEDENNQVETEPSKPKNDKS